MIYKLLLVASVFSIAGCAATPTPTPTPTRPSSVSHAPTSFTLVCNGRSTPPEPQVTFTIDRDDDESVVVTAMDGKPLTGYETHTYVNAYMWTNGERRYVADRFSGVLTIKGDSASYDCRRPGAQLF